MTREPIDRLEQWAATQPDKPAIIMADTGEALSYAALDARANRIARWLVSLGRAEGDVVALMIENDKAAVELWWGARRAGAYYVPVSGNLSPNELDHILNDSGAGLLIASGRFGDLACQAAADRGDGAPFCYLLDDERSGCPNFENALAATDEAVQIPERQVGREFMYSSGTTGRPKGVRRALTPFAKRLELPLLEIQMREVFEISQDSVYLSVSPLYHATGRFLNRVIEAGGSCVIMRRFDPEDALAAIERYRVTNTQWVPTMFVRMLALPAETRTAYDLSSLKVALHSAAPCPQPVKRAMLDWWGPLIHEYYGGTENAGVTFIRAREWLEHPGSVGRPISGAVHILPDGEATEALPTGETGAIYFSGGVGFAYHNDQAKTRTAIRTDGWSTYGDYGHVDADGYLYISDRRDDLIITGGVNVYPKEIEDVLEQHPAVTEAAVIGVPDPEFGQRVIALVSLNHAKLGTEPLDVVLREHCLTHLSRMKCPRSFIETDEFPRNENGKLLKRVLREHYAKAPESA